MLIGSFCILLPLHSDYKILGTYFKGAEKHDFELTDNIFLRLKLNHDKDKFNYLKFKEYEIFSYFHELTGKKKLKANGFILGVVLKDSEEPEKFKDSLTDASKSLEKFDLFEMSEQEFEKELKKLFENIIEPLSTLSDFINSETLKQKVINRTKDLLSGGKEKRELAQELLDRIEDDEHKKIAEYCKNAERALDKQSYKRAVKYFENALELSEELIGKDSKIYQELEERVEFVKKIPSLKEDRDDIAEDARDALKDGNFHQAYLLYLKASKLSKKLVQFDKEEEYRLKAKALNDFAKVDKRFKKGR
jgi:chorismate mutase